MITRPMPFAHPSFPSGHSDAPLTPLPFQHKLGAHGGYPAPIRRTKMFGFNPGQLPPVNKVVGPPRLYG